MKFEDLKFIRLTQPDQFQLIPPELFGQVKNSELKIERLYQFGPLMLASPLTFLYVLVDETSVIKGVLWVSVNPFEEMFYVEMLSVDKEYQNNGDTLQGTLEFIKSIPDYKTLNQKIVMMTRHIKAFEKAGWKQSEKVRMEI